MAIKNYTTSVDTFKSIGEIQGELARHGAKQIMVDYENGKPTAISFAMVGAFGPCAFTLPAAVEGTRRVFQRQKVKANDEQAERTAWRNVRDWIFAQMALIESCDVPVTQVFLPYMTNREGKTLYDIYKSGQLLLSDGGRE